MKLQSVILILIAVLTAPVLCAQNAKEIGKKALDVTQIDAMEMVSTLRIYDPKGRERVRQISTASKKFGETTKVITKFIAPADVKGIGILVNDYDDKEDDMWIYLPALRKVRRIVSSEKSKSFMGSEFSNADMSKPNINDYTFTLIGTELYVGEDCWIIESVPKNDDIINELGFSRKVTLIAKANYCTYKVIYYDADDELHKKMLISGYEEVGNGKFMARQMEVNNFQNGRKSVLTIDKLQMGSTLTENNFTPAMLTK